MIAMTLAEVVEATGGMLHHADPAVLVSVVSTDSRSVKPGDLFVALVGPTHDGHDHVAEALASGAVVALVSQPMGVPSVVVADTMVALGRLARAQLDRLPDCTVVAITGSSGKTSTKDLVAAVLADAAETIAPPGSFNNEVGLPVTA
ncbi:MAG: UDP-N-acetylmuramoyl-tripeptide--D-alanyl-D-alanine ligase, partial [Actinobacteria bacterium]|nr:UDP-N-acetylmuramoyl-tripeptide--D-alanyl-D-alanine ligase [Actinomycetota bacterium]